MGSGANSYRVWSGYGSGPPQLKWTTAFRLAQHRPLFHGYHLQLLCNTLGPTACSDNVCGSVEPPKRILILKKKLCTVCIMSTGAGIANTGELQNYLKVRFPKYVIDVAEMSSMSSKDQLSLITQSSVMFSHGGGGVFGAIFLPQGALLAMKVAINSEFRFFLVLSWFTSCRLSNDEGNVNETLAAELVHKQCCDSSLTCNQDVFDDPSWSSDPFPPMV